ncbi:conjugal transfer protein TraB [Streptomyces marianii]|uniref:Conjugal transfer protein TraB n=1 Tax=Streptomyces marianii TaxID=1817406 RepID=A0A5R9DSN3_9ACTN|nr:conjugal transfer protein TraB [Streptomyces marianii]
MVPRGDTLPAIPADGEGLGFLALSVRVTALTAQAMLLKEKVWALQRRMDSNADKASNMSEMCDAAEVEPQFTALILDGSVALRKVADASGELANAADVMQTDAQGFNDAHQGEYGGIYEATQTMGVKQPKPGFNEVK